MDNHHRDSPIDECRRPVSCAKSISSDRCSSHTGSRLLKDLAYLSPLKAFLTALVILHHTAIFYGGSGNLPTRSSNHPPNSEPALVAFNAVDQTFFMALFFFIAAFLSKRSLARRGNRGVGEFVRGRMWRLGVPAVVYSLFGSPACGLLWAVGRGERVLWSKVWADLTDVKGARGPVWFCALRLIFDVLLARFWTLHHLLGLQKRRPDLPEDGTVEQPFGPGRLSTAGHISGPKLLASLALLSLVDFLWRIRFPVGEMFILLNLNLGYLTQYITAYALALMVPTPEYAIPSTHTFAILGTASALSGFILARSMGDRVGDAQDSTLGGMNALAGAYAVWNNSMGYFIAAGFLHLFHEHVKISWKKTTGLAYSAFLVHLPVSTLIGALLENWQAVSAVKTFVIGCVNVAASWAVAWAWQAISSAVLKEMTRPLAENRQVNHFEPDISKRRIKAGGEDTIEILEGLDEVGC